MSTANLAGPGRAERYKEIGMKAPSCLLNIARTGGDLFQALIHTAGAIDPRYTKRNLTLAKKELREAKNHITSAPNDLVRCLAGGTRESIGAIAEAVSYTINTGRRNTHKTRLGKQYNKIHNRGINTLAGLTQTAFRVPLGVFGTVDAISQGVTDKLQGKQNTNNSERARQAIGDIFLVNGIKQTGRHIWSGEDIHEHFTKTAMPAGRGELDSDSNTTATRVPIVGNTPPQSNSPILGASTNNTISSGNRATGSTSSTPPQAGSSR